MCFGVGCPGWRSPVRMNVLEHQVRAFRAHYTPMRAKMGEMWNGISNFADNFVEVWNQWGPAERKAFFGRALATYVAIASIR